MSNEKTYKDNNGLEYHFIEAKCLFNKDIDCKRVIKYKESGNVAFPESVICINCQLSKLLKINYILAKKILGDEHEF